MESVTKNVSNSFIYLCVIYCSISYLANIYKITYYVFICMIVIIYKCIIIQIYNNKMVKTKLMSVKQRILQLKELISDGVKLGFSVILMLNYESELFMLQQEVKEDLVGLRRRKEGEQ